MYIMQMWKQKCKQQNLNMQLLEFFLIFDHGLVTGCNILSPFSTYGRSRS